LVTLIHIFDDFTLQKISTMLHRHFLIIQFSPDFETLVVPNVSSKVIQDQGNPLGYKPRVGSISR
jgi:hypothetical protein